MGIQRMTPGEARDYLARYLFRGEDVFRRVSSLSGGERGRVALAKLALGTANLLLLDEPTNHLDIPAQEVLEDMLSEYPGTVLVVSHDRYLIDALATQVWAARPPAEDDTAGRVHVFHGSWTEYAEHREQQRLAQQAAEAEAKRAAAQKTQRRSNSGKSKDGLNDYQRQKRVAAVEEHITELETRLEEITAEIEAASAAGDAATVQALGEEYTQTETDLDAAMTEWESLLDA